MGAGKVCQQSVVGKAMGLLGGRGGPIEWCSRAVSGGLPGPSPPARLVAITIGPVASARIAASTPIAG
jgi:hypothetical protein